MKKGKGLALLAVASYYILGGFDFILIDQITNKIPSTLMISFRLIICGIVLAAFALAKKYRFSYSPKEWVRVVVCAFLGISAYYIIEAIGISMTSGSIASLVLATIPFFGMISGALFYKEKVTAKSISCMVASIAGVIFVVIGNGQASFGATITGVLVMVLAALIWVMYIVAVKPLTEKGDPLKLTTILFIIGGALCLPAFFCSKPSMLATLTSGELALTVISAVLMIALGQLMYIYGVDKVTVTELSLYANLIPIITVIFSFVFFKEALSMMQIIGGIVILLSVTIASKE